MASASTSARDVVLVEIRCIGYFNHARTRWASLTIILKQILFDLIGSGHSRFCSSVCTTFVEIDFCRRFSPVNVDYLRSEIFTRRQQRRVHCSLNYRKTYVGRILEYLWVGSRRRRAVVTINGRLVSSLIIYYYAVLHFALRRPSVWLSRPRLWRKTVMNSYWVSE